MPRLLTSFLHRVFDFLHVAASGRWAVWQLALASRVCLTVVAIFFNVLIPDHDAGVLTYDTCSASITGGRGAASSCTFLDTVLGTFTKWDSAQFLAIADSMWDTAIGRGHAFDGYTSEASHAFLPLFPAIVRVTTDHVIWPLTDGFLSHRQALVVTGVMFSNACFIVAAVQLLNLAKVVLVEGYRNSCDETRSSTAAATQPAGGGADALARLCCRVSPLQVAVAFVVGPAGVFFSMVYTESFFAALTFGGLNFYLRGRRVAGTLLLATATAARSNGMLAAAYPAYFWARSLAFEFEWRPTKTAPPRVRARGWRCGAKAVSSFFVVLMESCVIVVPFVAYLHYWNSKFCTSNKGGVVADDAVFHFNPCMDDARLVFNAGGSVPEGPCVVPEWCDNNNVLPAEEEEEVSEGGVQSFFWFMWPPSNMYSHIQTKYWNVGWFNYYTAAQLPNFLLAAPVVSVVLGGSVTILWALGRRLLAIFRSSRATQSLKKNVAHNQHQLWSTSSSYASMRTASLVLPFLVHAVALCIYGVLTINVQVLTRLLAASTAATHWIVASLLFHRPSSAATKHGHHGRTACLVLLWVLSYNVLGVVLHPNALPWT